MIKYLLSFLISLLIIFNIFINKSIDKNKEVVEFFNGFILDGYSSEVKLPNIEYKGVDYVGVISVDGISLPIKSRCSDFYFNIDSACGNTIIFGSNLKNSFSNYKEYNVGDVVSVYNGYVYNYRIVEIKRVKELEIENSDLAIVIKNYYSMEYVIVKCEII